MNALALLLCSSAASGRVLDIDDFGAVAGVVGAAVANGLAFSRALSAAMPGDTVWLSNGGGTYYMQEVSGASLHDVRIELAGSVAVDSNISAWPAAKHLNWLALRDSRNVTISGGGTVDGQGLPWWDASITGSHPVGETRPNLLQLTNVSDLLLERLTLLNSPHFHIKFKQCSRVVVRYVTIRVDRLAQRTLKARAHAARLARAGLPYKTLALPLARHLYRLRERHAPAGPLAAELAAAEQDEALLVDEAPAAVRDAWRDRLLDLLAAAVARRLPSWALQPEDLNTDGIDPHGVGFHVHDVDIVNDDDSIAVKPAHAGDPDGPHECSSHMLLEHLTLRGFGASVGSVPPHAGGAHGACVSNVTFRNVSMPHTGKGIYVKSNPSCGVEVDPASGKAAPKRALLSTLLFEDVAIAEPVWWAVWIGPQQQHEPGEALGAKCALAYPLVDKCPTQGCATFEDLTLRRVTIHRPLLSPGVLLGNASNPMANLRFEDVFVTWADDPRSGAYPWGRTFQCLHADVHAEGSTSPKPVCTGMMPHSERVTPTPT